MNSKAIVLLDKYSDILELYSFLNDFSGDIDINLYATYRLNQESLDDFFSTFLKASQLNYSIHSSREAAFDSIRFKAQLLNHQDYLILPFVRWRQIWPLSRIFNRKYKTIHLSEAFVDGFGLFGYRLGYRIKTIAHFFEILPAYFYALLHKPDACYFPLMPNIKNPFTKKSYVPIRPPLSKKRFELLDSLLGNSVYHLIIGGFGYDPIKMADTLGIKNYVATSKNKEIIINGELISTPYFICAEEVLLFCKPLSLITYTSSVVAWAKQWYPDLYIDCYLSPNLQKQYGFLFNYFMQRTLKKINVNCKPVQPKFIKTQLNFE